MKGIINAAIVVIIISNQITAVSNFILPLDIPYKEYGINIPLFFLLIIINWDKGYKVNQKYLLVFFLLCSPLLAGYFFETIRILIEGEGYNILKTLLLFINLVITFFSIIIVVKTNEGFIRVLKYYYFLNVFIASSAVIVFILLQSNMITLENWSLPSFIGTSFERKVEFYSGNFNYYFPLCITIIASYSRDIGIFGSFGAFTGLSFEPHLAGYFMGPAFFMGWYFLNGYNTIIKSLVWICFILFFLIATSLTNLISISIVTLLYVTINLFKSPSFFFRVVIGFNILLWPLFIFFSDYINLFWSYADYKFNSRSNEESSGFLEYILSPKDYLGDGIFNFPIVTQNRNVDDIGIIGMLIFLFIFAILIISIIYILFYKKKFNWLAYSILYFTIHSLKFPFHVIQYPFIIFIFSILAFNYTHKLSLDND